MINFNLFIKTYMCSWLLGIIYIIFLAFSNEFFFGRFGLFYRINNSNYFNSRVDSFSKFLLSETYFELSLSLKQFSF